MNWIINGINQSPGGFCIEINAEYKHPPKSTATRAAPSCAVSVGPRAQAEAVMSLSCIVLCVCVYVGVLCRGVGWGECCWWGVVVLCVGVWERSMEGGGCFDVSRGRSVDARSIERTTPLHLFPPNNNIPTLKYTPFSSPSQSIHPASHPPTQPSIQCQHPSIHPPIRQSIRTAHRG